MRKPFNNNKGLSPVVSTVLMILVVMIGMTILFAFVNVYASNFQAGSGGAVLESMTIEDVWFQNTTQNPTPVELWIYNVGKIDFKIPTIYVNGTLTPFDMHNLSGTQIPPSTLIKIGDHVMINMTLPLGSIYNIKIVTARGSALEKTYSTTSQGV